MSASPPSPSAVLSLRGVAKSFAPRPKPWTAWFGAREESAIDVLRSVDLTIGPGEVVGLIGPNGAGKTLLLKIIATLTTASSGEVRAFGFDAERESGAIRARIGFATSDERCFYSRLSARQNLDFFSRLYGFHRGERKRRVEEALESLGLTAVAKRPFRLLSAGNRQRLAIARALLHDPELLLLDEPTSRLDPEAAEALRSLLRERTRDRRRAVLLATHDLDDIRALCERVLVLVDGRIRSSGSTRELLERVRGEAHPCWILVVRGAQGALQRCLADERDLIVRTLDERSFELRLAATDDAGQLHRALASAMKSGLEIESCRREESTLPGAFAEMLRKLRASAAERSA